MHLIVHRGTHEIGGSCVELGTEDGRLLLDLGVPLVKHDGTPFELNASGRAIQDLIADGTLPSVEGLYAHDDKGVTALIVSQAHLDHYGLAGYTHPDIPVYASEGTRALLDVSAVFLRHSPEFANLCVLPKGIPIEIGPFRVTALVIDHSAPDALMLMVEAEGKKVLYSGDVRAHGRKGGLFEQLVRNPPAGIDCLLLEGTTIGRAGQDLPSERAVEEAVVRELRERTNLAIVICSSQNIDRLVSLYRAVKRTGSVLVIDLYTAYVLQSLRCISDRLPQFDWPLVRVKYWKHHADTLAKAGKVDFLYEVNKSKIEVEEIVARRGEIVLLAKANSLSPIIPRKLPSTDGLVVVWSMWSGYLIGQNPLSRFCAEFHIEPKYIHTSGHATVADLRRLVTAIGPARLIPIHTFHPDRFRDLFPGSVELDDGQTVYL